MSTRREFFRATLLVGASVATANACRGLSARPRGSRFGDLQKFRSAVTGRVILPGDPEYDEARRGVWSNPLTDKHPAIVVRCESGDDVARCVEFAREQSLPLAVRSGGHSFLGWSIGDGLVVDLSRLKSIKLAGAQRRLRVGAGVTAAEMLAVTAKQGLAPVLGECGTVGAGLALGGGLGWLSGRYGAACDNLLSARLITAGGDSVTADDVSNPDLYWAIRGGGGNFGIATLLEFRLHAVREMVTGGFVYPAANASAVLRSFRDFMAGAPDELQGAAYLESVRGGTLTVLFVHSGALATGERLMGKFRSHGRPERDWVQRRSYADIHTMPPFSDDGPSCKAHAVRGSYLESLSDEAIATVTERFAKAPPACAYGFAFDHYMHGEVSRIAPDATAFELRTARAVPLAFGADWNEVEQANACIAWLDETWRQLQAYSGGRMYTNYISVEGDASARAAYGRNYSRLVSLKRKYDPQNVFRGNLNIRPWG